MSVYSLKTIQKMPVPVSKAWDFFSNPNKLQLITSKEMAFKVLGDQTDPAMYAGQVIEYKVRPLFGIPVYWMTEITHVVDQVRFVDEQRFGPFAMWHHQHHFREIDRGVEMTDIVHYKIPYWFIGDIANALMVRKKVRQIFEYRFEKIEELFGKWTGSQERSIIMR